MRAKADRGLAALLLGSCLIVPWAFSLAHDDVFALPKSIALGTIAILGIVPLAVDAALRQAPTRRRRVTLDCVLLLAFVALNVVACFASLDGTQSLVGEPLQRQGLLSILLYAWFLLLARRSIRNARRIALLFWAVTIGALAVSAYALVQWAGLDPIWNYPGRRYPGRVLSTIGQPNALAAYLVLATAASAGLWMAAARLRSALRAMLALAMGMMLASLVLTFSRGGSAGLLIAASTLTVDRLRQGMRDRWRIAAGLLAGASLTAGIAWQVPSIRVGDVPLWADVRSSVLRMDTSMRQHLALWTVAGRVAADYPYFGTGQETFAEVFVAYRDVVLSPRQAELFEGVRAESPHNVYLAVASGAGIPALLAYLGLITTGIVRLVRAMNAAGADSPRRAMLAALLAAIAGHLVTDAFMTAELTSSWLFWVLMGAALGSTRTSASDGASRRSQPRDLAGGPAGGSH